MLQSKPKSIFVTDGDISDCFFLTPDKYMTKVQIYYRYGIEVCVCGVYDHDFVWPLLLLQCLIL